MKRVTLIAVSLALIWMASGCATVQTAKGFGNVNADGASKPIVTVAAENYGYYLFGSIPLVAGAPASPNATAFRLFDETVTLENNLAMIAQSVRAEDGKRIANVKTVEDWTGSFSFWIIWRKTLFTSALITE